MMAARRVVGLLAVSLGAVSTAAADGMLDPSFGNGGLVVTNFPGVLTGDSVASLVVLPDGRAVAAGMSNDFGDIRMGVARYLFSGALDTSFSGDGMTTIACPPTGIPGGGAADVQLQPDGFLVLVGDCVGPSPGRVFWLARLNANGFLDLSFGSGGQVFTPFATDARAVSGLLQPDGRILAVGYLDDLTQPPTIAAARYNVDGTLDPSFGTAGQITLPLTQPFTVGAAALQPDGKLVIGGTYGSDFGLVRVLLDGALDPSFDGDGLATANFGGTERGESVIVLPDGRLVLGGSHNADFGLVRFLPDGSVDSTFGTNGLATADSGVSEVPGQLIRLPNGKLLLAGWSDDGADDFLLTRLLADGALDTSFGTAGFLRTDFGGPEDHCFAVAMAAPDRILTAGSSIDTSPPGTIDFALARYIASTPVELLTFEVE